MAMDFFFYININEFCDTNQSAKINVNKYVI